MNSQDQQHRNPNGNSSLIIITCHMLDSLKTKTFIKPATILYSGSNLLTTADPNVLRTKQDFTNRTILSSSTIFSKPKEPIYTESDYISQAKRYEAQLKTMSEEHSKYKEAVGKRMMEILGEVVHLLGLVGKNVTLTEQYKKGREIRQGSNEQDLYREYTMLKDRILVGNTRIVYRLPTRKEDIQCHLNPQIKDRANKLTIRKVFDFKIISLHKENVHHSHEKLHFRPPSAEKDRLKPRQSPSLPKPPALPTQINEAPNKYKQKIRFLEQRVIQEEILRQEQAKLVQELNQSIVQLELQNLNQKWKSKARISHY